MIRSSVPPKSSNATTGNNGGNGDGGDFNWGWLFIGLLLVGLLGYCSSQSGKKSQPNNSSAPAINLSYRTSCGSPYQSVSQWYAVVGDRASLNTVKSRYCADSFIRKDRNVQVASFTSEQEAQQFANALQQATGYQFWVRVSVRK